MDYRNITLTEEMEKKLLANGFLLQHTNRSYAPGELSVLYRVYNDITGELKKDSGCGSCRRQVVSTLHMLYMKLIKEKGTNDGQEV